MDEPLENWGSVRKKKGAVTEFYARKQKGVLLLCFFFPISNIVFSLPVNILFTLHESIQISSLPGSLPWIFPTTLIALFTVLPRNLGHATYMIFIILLWREVGLKSDWTQVQIPGLQFLRKALWAHYFFSSLVFLIHKSMHSFIGCFED